MALGKALRGLALRQRVLHDLHQELQLRRPGQERHQVRQGVVVPGELEGVGHDARLPGSMATLIEPLLSINRAVGRLIRPLALTWVSATSSSLRRTSPDRSAALIASSALKALTRWPVLACSSFCSIRALRSGLSKA